MQDALLEAHRDFGQFRGQTFEELRAWLLGILRSTLADFVRLYYATDKRQVGREVSMADGADGQPRPRLRFDSAHRPLEEMISKEESVRVRQAVVRLPVHYRRVVIWRYRQGRSFVEMGLLLNREPDAVRMLWCRALKRLRGSLSHDPT